MDLLGLSLLRMMLIVRLPLLLHFLNHLRRHKLYQILKHLYLEQVSWLLALRFAQFFFGHESSLLANVLRQAFPTRALKNELCFSFVTINRCWKAHHCPGIHPYDRVFYRYRAFEQNRLRQSRLSQAPCPGPENTLVPDAEPMMMTAPSDPVSLQPSIPQAQPKAKTRRRRKKKGPSADIENDPTLVMDPTDDLQQWDPVPPAEKNNTVFESTSGDDVHTWGDTFHDSRWSDTSSISEDLNVPGRWDPETGFWENFTDLKAWSDSDATTDDMQTLPEGTGGQIFHSVPESTTQLFPVKEQKHPFPRYNERCRRWLWGECDLGYQCKYVHEDLEYDDPPVSFDLSSCNRSFHVSILTGTTGENYRKFFNYSS